jgi:4-alpha-glucanotransferase
VDEAVRELARAAGILTDWVDSSDQPQQVGIGTLRAVLSAVGLPCDTRSQLEDSRARLRQSVAHDRPLVTTTVGAAIALPVAAPQALSAELLLENGERRQLTLEPSNGMLIAPPIDAPGYHRLYYPEREVTLAVAPPRCLTIADIAPQKKLYGLAVQLYALRRAHDCGIGDTTALTAFAICAAREGADAIALSPTHSLFAADPGHYGPYSPSSRLFSNPLYADPAVVFGADRVAAAQAAIGAIDPAPSCGSLIDWPQAAARKFALLARLFEDFAAHELPAPRSKLASAFHAFAREGGDRLQEHALFEALHQYWFAAPEPTWNWRDWPADWRTPQSPGVTRFAHDQARAVRFHMFLQWLTAESFSAAQQAARDAGMRIGLISDLAVGMSPGGSHAWSRQQDLLLGLSVGAPPDLINARGQNWGLTAFSPRGLRASGFEPFIATLRAALHAAGGVRIDHAMGLSRLWLIPEGASPTEGAYLQYPLDDLLRLVALESHRHHAIVIGEDLGTVQPAFRKRIADCGIAGMDVLWFQREKNAFLPPPDWRADAVAMTTTHDLPTVAGWWSGADIEMRATLGFVPDKAREERARKRDRRALWRTFRKANAVKDAEPAPNDAAPAVDAAIAFVAQAPSHLALIPLEDVLGLAEQPNLPGTIDEHPNWRRRLEQNASEVLAQPQARRRLKILRERA